MRISTLTLLLAGALVAPVAFSSPVATNGVASAEGKRTMIVGGKAIKIEKGGGDISSQFRSKKKNKKKGKRDDRIPIPHKPEDVVLKFNGEVLTWGALDGQIDLFMMMSPLSIPPIATADEVKQIVTMTRNKHAARLVNLYVRNALLGQVARKEGLSVSVGELEEALTNSVRKIPEKHKSKVLEEIRKPGSYFRADQENYLLTVKYRKERLMDGVMASDEEVEAAIKDRQDEISAAREKNASLRPQLEKWSSEIRAGKRDFAETAEQFSDCDSSSDGGNMGSFSMECNLRPELKAFAFAASTNELSDVIETPRAFHLVRVVRRYYDEKSPENAENPDMGVSDAAEQDEAAFTNLCAKLSVTGARRPTAVELAQIMLERADVPEPLDRAAAHDLVIRRKLGKKTVAAQEKALAASVSESVFPIKIISRKQKTKKGTKK